MTVLAEEYVFGRELTVAVLDMGEGLKAFPIIEIKAPDGDYDFEHKYFLRRDRLCVPGRSA